MKTIFLIICLTFSYNGNIQVFSPLNLRGIFKNGNIPNTIADFGIVPYGHSISGKLLKGEPFDGCDPFSIPKSVLNKVQGNLIILVERGGCNFSQKVINAQKIGASAVLISDNDADKDVHKIFAVERVKMQLDQVRIPSMLINKEDSDILENNLNEDKQIELGMDFELRKAEKKSKLSFVLSVDDYRCYDSLLSLHNYFETFKKSMEVTVHYKVFRNVKVMNSSECTTLQNNKFCILNSFGNNLENQGLMGETLKQMCIYKYSQVSFFDYLQSVRNYCFKNSLSDSTIADGFSNCTNKIFHKYFGDDATEKKVLDTGDGVITSKPSKIVDQDWPGTEKIKPSSISQYDKDKILNCSRINGDEVSSMLEQNNDDLKYYLINYSPIVFINGVYYKGNFDDVTHLLEAFCSSFEHEPKECETLDSFQILRNADTSVFFDFLLKGVFSTAAFIVFVGLGFYIFYKKRIRGLMDIELHGKINQAIANYYGTHPVDINTIGITKEEKQNLDVLVQKLDRAASNSVKDSKSEVSLPSRKSNNKMNAHDAKSMMNMHKVQEQIDSEEDYDCHPNNMTFS